MRCGEGMHRSKKPTQSAFHQQKTNDLPGGASFYIVPSIFQPRFLFNNNTATPQAGSHGTSSQRRTEIFFFFWFVYETDLFWKDVLFYINKCIFLFPGFFSPFFILFKTMLSKSWRSYVPLGTVYMFRPGLPCPLAVFLTSYVF